MEGVKCPGKGVSSSRKLGAAAVVASVAARPVGGALLMSLAVVHQCGISITVVNVHHVVKQGLLCHRLVFGKGFNKNIFLSKRGLFYR